MTILRRTLIAAFAVAAAAGAVSVHAQAYPNKPIRVIVPFPPGGGTDIVAREVTQAVADTTGWNFVVENRPGAGGNLGLDVVAKAPADGYTIGLGQTSNLAINPTLYRRMPYDVAKDLAPILAVADSPLVMVTGSGMPYKTLKDVVAAAKSKPGGINIAFSGNGTVSHLAAQMLQNAAGIKAQYVPYKGATQALTDVVAGNVDVYVSSIPTLLGQIHQGKLRPLAVTSAKKTESLPQVPTMQEAGYQAFEAVNWFGFVAPAGTPKDVIAKLNAEFNKALKTPALAKKLDEQGAEPSGGTPEKFAAFIKSETVSWGQVVKQSGAQID